MHYLRRTLFIANFEGNTRSRRSPITGESCSLQLHVSSDTERSNTAALLLHKARARLLPHRNALFTQPVQPHAPDVVSRPEATKGGHCWQQIRRWVHCCARTRAHRETRGVVSNVGFVTGKSSLAVQFVDGHFVDSYYPTIENTFTKNIRYKGQDFTTEIVDTAGQVSLPRARREPGCCVNKRAGSMANLGAPMA